MKHTYKAYVGGLLLVGGLVIHGAAGCSSAGGGFVGSAFDSGGGGVDASVKRDGGSDATMRVSPESGALRTSDAKTPCPSSCAKLNASCGAVTDTFCGGVVQCGGCGAGTSCGGGGVHNVCGAGASNPDAACVPKSCADQKLTCGQATDGCNSMPLECGSCSAPQTCGGDPSKPGQCGCSGECSGVVACDGGSPTTLTGAVYDPANLHPLYNVLVYVPNDPTDPGLQPFAPGVTCSQCGATAAGNPLVTTLTAPDGTFTLKGVPVGSSIPLVIQLGHWRRQFTVNTSKSCAPNALPSHLNMPATHAEGDIPRIAIVTGALDPIECVLRQLGIADSEFTDPGKGGHINFFLSNDPSASSGGSGAVLDMNTPTQDALFATPDGGAPVIDQYDMVYLECEGYPPGSEGNGPEKAADLAAIPKYAAAGGRVFASDFAYAWLIDNYPTVANWTGDHSGIGFGVPTASIDLMSNPQGMAFEQWLQFAGISMPGSGTVPITIGFGNTPAIVAPTQQWLYGPDMFSGNNVSLHFTFNTPVGAASAQQCGRVVFSDWHSFADVNQVFGATFPNECPPEAMTAQEAILEFMFFDLAACVQPYTPICTPNTCTGEGITCGPASDGCGNLLNCGSCPMGETCGGGGAGKCGTSAHCPPESCMTQGIECGQAGDGCGNVIDCGNCQTGAICGANGAGKCGMIQ